MPPKNRPVKQGHDGEASRTKRYEFTVQLRRGAKDDRLSLKRRPQPLTPPLTSSSSASPATLTLSMISTLSSTEELKLRVEAPTAVTAVAPAATIATSGTAATAATAAGVAESADGEAAEAEEASVREFKEELGHLLNQILIELKSEDMSRWQRAADRIMKLQVNRSNLKPYLIQAGLLPIMLHFFSSPVSAEQQGSAVTILRKFTSDEDKDCLALFAVPEVVRQLVTVGQGVKARIISQKGTNETEVKTLFEILWILNNVVSQDSAATKVVVDHGGVQLFVEAFHLPLPLCQENALWGLANIAGEREYSPLMSTLPVWEGIQACISDKNTPKEILVQAAFFLTNCFLSPQSLATAAVWLPLMGQLIHSPYPEVWVDACDSMVKLMKPIKLSTEEKGSERLNQAEIQARIKLLADLNLCPRLREILLLSRLDRLKPRLRKDVKRACVKLVGQLTLHHETKSMEQIVEAGLVAVFGSFLEEEEKKGKDMDQTLCKEICWVLCNLAHEMDQTLLIPGLIIPAMLKANCDQSFLRLLQGAKFNVHIEAANALSNLINFGDSLCLHRLIQTGLIPVLSQSLESAIAAKDASFILVLITSLITILSKHQTHPEALIALAAAMEAQGIIQSLDTLSEFGNEEVNEKVESLLHQLNHSDLYYDPDESGTSDLSLASGLGLSAASRLTAPTSGSTFTFGFPFTSPTSSSSSSPAPSLVSAFSPSAFTFQPQDFETTGSSAATTTTAPPTPTTSFVSTSSWAPHPSPTSPHSGFWLFGL